MIDSAPGRRPFAALLLVAALALASWFKPLDAVAGRQLDAGMTAAFASFATARALNAAISLLQSGQVGAQAGVGMSVRPGELLDPVNDLVERFSNFMLAATVAFGVQKVLLSVGAHWVMPLLLSLVAVAWALLHLRGRPRPRWLGQAFVLLLMVRFAVPVATVGTDLLFQAFLAPKYEASQQSLDRIQGQAASVDAASGSPDAADKGLVATIRGWLAQGVDLREKAEELARAAGRMAEHVTNLMVVFLLQTLVFPLALLWLLYQGVRAVLIPRAGAG